jgi:alanyl-tRNA synthetase
MTGEIGPILISGIERAKKQTRIQFICGDRVVRYAREANRVLESISQTISSPPLEAATSVRALWDELQQSRKKIEDLESRLLDYEAAGFTVQGGMAVAAFQNRGIDTIKMLALKICNRPGIVALLADESDQLRVVFARSSDVDADCAGILKRVLERFGGRGGGRPNLAQGGGLTAQSPREVLDFASKITRG